MAGALVGGAILSAFLQVAFDRLASRDVLDFFQKRRLNETLLKKLNICLLSINAVIDDAEQKEITNPNVKAWLDEVKGAVYDAEDVLDEIDYEVTKRKVEAEFHSSTVTAKVRNFFAGSGSSFDKEIESRMKQVLDNLECLESRKDILGLKEGRCVGVGSVRKLQTTSLVDEGRIFGRNDDKDMVINWLLSENDNSSHLSIISIVGMGGLGKTALAQLIYNDLRVKDEFDLKAWVCVSDDFDVTRVTRAIIEAITMSSNDDIKDLNGLQIKLKGIFTGKRFLLVLDDLWNDDYMQWEALETPFNYGALGSKIIVTTRSDIVASTVHSSKIHSLKRLTEEDSWLLFKKYAFRDEDAPFSNSDFEVIGEKIIKKCKGLPLALKTIGSLLYTKLSVEEWNDILESEMWEEGRNILPALRLSYHYLPSLLKRCFAYCSIFPKDHEFSKERLVELWMAENFLPCAQQRKDLYEVGDQLFCDLLSRSFFQRSSGDKTNYVMHDLINDWAKNASGDFCFRKKVDKAQKDLRSTRHFSYLTEVHDAPRRFDAIYKADGLRTFLHLSGNLGGICTLMISRKVIQNLLFKFRCLRVLSLSGYCHITELPKSVGDLKYLRYLDLSYSAMRRLPDSICLLYNLQTLKLRFCYDLEELPTDLHKLINLRHLDLRGTMVRNMPKQLGKLKNLQVLPSFYVGKCNETNIKQLGDLNLRGSLSILDLQNVPHPLDSLAANLKNKIHLEELMLEWSMKNDESHNQRYVLENLQPHRNLKKLSISNYGDPTFPLWLADNTWSNIVSLELSNCKYCSSLPSLGLLSSLKSLSIIGFDSIVAIGPEFYGNSSCTTPFVSLEILRFKQMERWEEWKCENVPGAFPCLRKFYIKECPKLKEHIPAQLPSLTELVIKECEQLVASLLRAPAINKLVLRNCGKVQLEYLPPSLKVLCIREPFTECFLVEKFENMIADTCLEELDISDCATLEFPLPRGHNFLQKMWIESSCDSLRTFPLDLFPKLRSLELNGCRNLETISVFEGHDHHLTSLSRLNISNCPKFVSFPKGGFSAPKLEECWFRELESLKSLPDRMHILFPSLTYLLIDKCPKVESFSDGGLPTNLKTLCIYSSQKLTASRMEWDLHTLTSLQGLWITDQDAEFLPDVGLLPPTLTCLGVAKCSNLRTLDYKSLCNLSSLETLVLTDCPKFQCFPKEGLPRSLHTLQICGSPLLKKRCQKQKGKEWSKIAHIACVSFDGDCHTPLI